MSSKEKVLITGAGGFIGSHLTEHLLKKGYNVKAFVRYNSKNSWGWLDHSQYKNDIDIISGDIRDYDSVRKAVDGCSSIFHLAALIGIPYSYESPLAYIKTNIEGTYNILEAAKSHNIEQVLITSTSETYGTAQYVPIDEKHPNVGHSPYAASKIAADQLAISYYRSFKLPVKIVRPFNTYGPRQSARGIIPTIITQILSNQKKIILGNVSPKRDFLHVKDTASGFFEIFKSGNLYGEATNIGSGQEISIHDLTKKIITLMDSKAEIQTETKRKRPENSEVHRLYCNNSKLSLNTQWNPHFSIEDGLRDTISWFTDNIAAYKAGIYNV